MDTKTLEQKIDDRAKELTRDAIYAFQNSCFEALKTLLSAGSYQGYAACRSNFSDEDRSIFSILVPKEEPPKAWPRKLLEKRKAIVTEDVMSKMDTLQRMLAAKEDKSNLIADEKPAETAA